MIVSRAISGGVVKVRLVLIGNGWVGRDENGVRQLADRVIGVRPRAVPGRLGDAAAEVIVGIVEPRVDRAVRRVIDQMQQFAGRIVGVGRIGAVAVVFRGESRPTVS